MLRLPHNKAMEDYVLSPLNIICVERLFAQFEAHSIPRSFSLSATYNIAYDLVTLLRIENTRGQP